MHVWRTEKVSTRSHSFASEKWAFCCNARHFLVPNLAVVFVTNEMREASRLPKVALCYAQQQQV